MPGLANEVAVVAIYDDIHVTVLVLGPLLELVARASAGTGADRGADERAGRAGNRRTDDATGDRAPRRRGAVRLAPAAISRRRLAAA